MEDSDVKDDTRDVLAEARELKATAEKATPGPWCWEAHGQKSNDWTVGYAEDEAGNPLTGEIREPDFVVETVGYSEPHVLRKKVVIEHENATGHSDADYIAACSPDRILRLCEAVEKLHAECAAWRELDDIVKTRRPQGTPEGNIDFETAQKVSGRARRLRRDNEEAGL